MIKKILPYAKKYWLYTFLAPLFIIGEVLLEVRIPFLMAKIVDVGIVNKDIEFIVNQGLLMVGMALLSLLLGTVSARLGAIAGMEIGRAHV